MLDPLSLLSKLKRPAIIVKAARTGAAGYVRERDLSRVSDAPKLPGGRQAILMLLEKEEEMNQARGTHQYNVTKHVEIMIALLGEALLIKNASPNKS